MITKVTNIKEDYPSLNRRKFNQISFTGLPSPKFNEGFIKEGTALGRKCVGDKAASFTRKLLQSFDGLHNSIKGFIRKLRGNDELPFSEKPICHCGQNVANMMAEQWRKLEELKKQLDAGKITPSEYTQKVKDVNNYYTPIIESNPPVTITSTTVRQNEPKSIKHHEDFNNNSDNITSFEGRKSTESKEINDDGLNDNINNVDEKALNDNDGINDIDDVDPTNINGSEEFGAKELELDDTGISENDSEILGLDDSEQLGSDLSLDEKEVDFGTNDPDLSVDDDGDLISDDIGNDDMGIESPDVDIDPDIDIDPTDFV